MSPSEPLRRHGQTPLVISHRGASAAAPENTMAAFEAAWASGAQWVETDVQPTADGARVLIHDDAVDRTTNGTGAVRELTADEVAALDAGSWFDGRFGDARVPTLPALLARLTGDRRLLLEIKGDHSAEELRRIVADIDDAGVWPRVFLQSFEIAVLERLRELLPNEPIGLLVEEIGTDPVADCRRLGAVTYNPDVLALLERPQIVADLHAADIAVQPWFINDPDQWAALTELQVDGIITDDPAGLLAWQAAPGR